MGGPLVQSMPPDHFVMIEKKIIGGKHSFLFPPIICELVTPGFHRSPKHVQWVPSCKISNCSKFVDKTNGNGLHRTEE